MALIKCSECGKTEKRKTATRNILLFLIFTIVLFLTGCSQSTSKQVSNSIIPYGINKSMSVNDIIQILEKNGGFTTTTVFDDSALLENGSLYNKSGFQAEIHKDPTFLLRFYYRGEATTNAKEEMINNIQSKYANPRWEGITDYSHDYVWGDSTIIIHLTSSPDSVYIDFQDGDVESFLKTWLQQ